LRTRLLDAEKDLLSSREQCIALTEEINQLQENVFEKTKINRLLLMNTYLLFQRSLQLNIQRKQLKTRVTKIWMTWRKSTKSGTMKCLLK
jgi:hypothetical protein